MFEVSLTHLIFFSSLIVVISAVISVLLMNRKQQQQVANLHADNTQEQQHLQQQLQQQVLESTRWQERAQAWQQQLNLKTQELQQEKEQSAQLQLRYNKLDTQLAAERTARQQQQQSAEEKLVLLEQNKQQMLKEFELLSQKILEQKSRQFSEQNQKVNEQSQQGLDALLSPFKDQLEGLRKKVEDVHLHDAKDRASLKTQIGELHKLNQQMSSEAQALTTALRGEQKVQGNWGEMVLETVLERSGLRAGEEYVREQTHHNEDGQRYRPDIIINLPEGKHIIVDSKVSLSAYTDYINADDEQPREMALKRHVESVRAHIKGLSEKAYQELKSLNSPDFVFLFMPIESAFMLAFQHDENLFNEAFERRIVVVTPTTLLATLRTVSSLWAIERRNRNTEKIADQARLVYEKVVSLVDYMDRLGKQINTVQGTYDDAWKSLKEGRGNLLSRADNFQKLGVRVKKELSKTLVEEANAESELHDALAQSPLYDGDIEKNKVKAETVD